MSKIGIICQLVLIFAILAISQTQYPPFFKFAHQKADSDSINAIGNYATTAEDTFIIAPPLTETWVVERMIVEIEDAGALAAGNYGAISSGLDSGIMIQVNRDTVQKIEITNGKPVKDNIGWGAFSYDVAFQSFGAGNNFVQIRWTFGKAGQQIQLKGSEKDTLMIILNDDLTGLVGHYFQIQGYNRSAAP